MKDRPLSILVVSPDRHTLRRLSRFFEAFGYAVRQAADAPQALAAAQALRPDYLILDGSAGTAIDLQLNRQIRRLWPQGQMFAMLLAQKPDVGYVTAALEAGIDDFLAAPIVFGELLARLRAGARVIEFERRLGEQSGLEAVTDLPDRESLAGELQLRVRSAEGPLGSIALFDIDYFSRLADQFGRSAADTVLRQAAQFIQARNTPAVFAASLGEDQIAVLLPAGDDPASTWAEAALAALAEHQFSIAGEAIRLTASCGIAELVSGEALEAVLGRSLRALQLAKASGRNCVATSAEVDDDSEAWAEFAAEGKLFLTTVARDVMQHCPLLLSLDETVEQAAALLKLTGLSSAPVVDGEGRLAGIIALDQLTKLNARRDAKSKNSSSVRLVRHIVNADVVKFEESTSLARLLEFFTSEGAPLAIIVRDRCPRGIVHCQGLAALNEKLAPGLFAAAQPRTNSSADLLVPELALAE